MIDNEQSSIELSIVLPCRNEERTVGICVEKAKTFLTENQIKGEVIVSDNGSTDNSANIAHANGAKVIYVKDKGYGKALREGFSAANGKYIIMADSDDSYDLSNLMIFIEKLREGYDLVMGNRFKGGIQKGAMPWHHKYIGNPILSFIGKLFFNSPVNDFHCGLRGFSKEALLRMDLRTSGMELASEIVVKSALYQMKVCEVPTTLSPDGRDTAPHLRSFRDGWRHLRFLLIFSPRWLFFYPGLFLFSVGGIFSVALFFGPVDIGIRLIDFHSFILSGTIMFLGISMLSFSAITRVYAQKSKLIPGQSGIFSLTKYLNLERGLSIGFFFLLAGMIVISRAVILSRDPGFSTIGYDQSIRLVFGGSLSILTGGQIISTSFVLSMLGMNVYD